MRQPVAAPIAWPLAVPDAAADPELRFGVMHRSGAGPVTARVRAREAGASDSLLWQARLAPGEAVARARIDLRPWAGRALRVVFEAEAPAPGALAWLHPSLLARAGPARPPLILVCVDTLRRDHVDAYAPAGLTPHLAALAAEGVVFERAVAASSWTLPSVATVMTGLPPSVHGAGRRVLVQTGATLEDFERFNAIERGFVRFNRDRIYRFSALRSDVETLAERLSRHYFTHAVNSNLNLTRMGNVLNQGFDSTVYENALPGAELTRHALAWARENADSQLFLYAHYLEPHEWRYDGFDGRGVGLPMRARRTYADHVREADEAVGALLQGLRELGLYDDALLILFSDHGEHFWDDLSGTVHGHGNTLHNLAIDVPLIVKFPGAELAGTRVAAAVALADVFATVLQEAGVEPPGSQPGGSRSLRAVASQAGRARKPRVLVSEFTAKRDELFAVQRGRFKAVHNLDADRWSLRRADDDAVLPARGAAAEVLAELQQEASAFRAASARRASPPEPIEVTPEEVETLRRLGYVR